MSMQNRVLDSVRPSRDGHEFHEAWTARKAMQLLLPKDGLIGIAVEGLSEEDQAVASSGTVEVADLTVYYGEDANFRVADRVETLQFKYSPKRAEKPFRASDAKKTIEKFAESYRDYRKNYGAAAVTKKLSFQLITNRPIFKALQDAIDAIAEGRRLAGDEKDQADQFTKASGLTGKQLAEFASKCRIVGLAGTLKDTKTDLSKILVNWSATADLQAKARLGEMKEMVRKKAGYESEHQKVINQTDVLNALGLSDVEELLPCPLRLSEVGRVVDREQLAEVVSLIPSLTKPLVIHADGGIGKTVFLQSIAARLSKKHEVVFFDCFGGGDYRSPEDGRHLPNQGLVHIANELACRGLCDPILPGSDNIAKLFRTFRKRLEQCMNTLSIVSPDRQVVLFIDALDNSAEYAEELRQQAFPIQLLESIYHSGPLPGVKLVASSRSHRIKKYLQNLTYVDFELHPFTIAETNSFLVARIPDVTETEVRVAQTRSGGNARILEHLVTSGRGLLDSSEIDNPIVLNDLLRERIDSALAEALKQGYKKNETDAFLAGLSILPPPVPLDEYAGALGMDIGAVRSFAADFAPLLDRTPQGVIFRDEPTETFVRENYGRNERALKRVAKNLLGRQKESVYAAQALPSLLQKLGDSKMLFKLAFDERFPASIASTVGQKRIRFSRLKAAVLHFANEGDKNKLVHLLVELSTIATSDQKGANYILDNPDLVVNAQDTDALRRLFETRTSWKGARYARLTIASVLSDDQDEASHYFSKTRNWIQHDLESAADDDYNRPTPEHIDLSAIPFFQVAQEQPRRAISFMRIWSPWYAYEISEHFFCWFRQALRKTSKLDGRLNDFLDNLTSEIGPIAGALSFLELNGAKRRDLVGKLAKVCKRTKKLETSMRITRERPYELADGLRKAAAIAVSLGMNEEALNISLRAEHERPDIWVMAGNYNEGAVFSFLFRVALHSAVKGTAILERDLLSSDLVPFAKGMRRSLTKDQFKKKLKRKIEIYIREHQNPEGSEKRIRGGLQEESDHFLNRRLPLLLELTQALAVLLSSPRRKADKPFQDLVRMWVRVRAQKEGYYYEQQFNQFFQLLGMHMVMFALWARSDLKAVSVKFLLKYLHEQNYLDPSVLCKVIAIISCRPGYDNLAGEQAIQAKALIESEDNVNTRAELFAKLARAILPVSAQEATEYFRLGLEQLDAIGSGDFIFTNELLLFASSIKGKELAEKDFHTLTNICELNMPFDEEKFPWVAFATAMSRTSGPRGLAKLSRWHDRGKITLDYTLLPYLTALVRDNKITPEDAIALNRLADPVELWSCNTESFATAIQEKRSPNVKSLTKELIQQYQDNNPRPPSGNIMKALSSIAGDVLGKRQPTTRYLTSAYKRLDDVRHELNERMNYNRFRDGKIKQQFDDKLQKKRQIQQLALETDPLNGESLAAVIDRLSDGALSRELERKFFDKLRTKVRLADRFKYLGLVAQLTELDHYAIFKELEHCKNLWAKSSAGLEKFYQTLAAPILNIHADDFLSFDQLSGYLIKEVSELTGISLSSFTLMLVKVFVVQNLTVPASAWLGLASILCQDADEGQGQKALSKLLNSSSAMLTSNVIDGPWRHSLYPTNDAATIASGFVWQMLGSPRGADRWQAAHSVRCFARLERWQVIDALVDKLHSQKSPSFGAPELPFYYLHARLWLLITLARVALESPDKVAKYTKSLLKIALDQAHPHIVMRSFAAKAILACYEAGALDLSVDQRNKLQAADDSPFPFINEGKRHRAIADFYRGRPDDAPSPTFKFSLDYDFDKHEVHGLAGVFRQDGWRVKDLIAVEARRLDSNVTSMFEKGGRETPYRRGGAGLTSTFDIYGQYIAWHALRFVAARLLSQYPVTDDWDYGRTWSEWLDDRLLTRRDGLWLSDGMDRPPLAVNLNLLEKGEDCLVLTGEMDKLMSLIGMEDRSISDGLVIQGDWLSPDKIDVQINSALVPARKGRKLAKQLLEEDPFSVWLPTLNYDDDEIARLRSEKIEYEPWIVTPLREASMLEACDPLSIITVEQRPRFNAKIINKFSLKPGDPFQRFWRATQRKVVAITDAWGYGMPYEESSETGFRFTCKTDFLSKVLEWRKAELVILIKLRRHEKEIRQFSPSKYSHTIAVLRVKEDLKFEYHAGVVNQVKTLRF
jgi:hypothetical protein